MSPTLDRRALLVGLVAGLLVGVAAGGAAVSTLQPTRVDETPGTSWSAAGPTCFDGPQANAGWLHVVANGDRWLVTANATVRHSADTEVTVNVSRRDSGTYELALRTVPTTETKPADADCPLATRVTLGTRLESPDLVVTANGRTLRSVEQSETLANLYPLPNPVDATG